MPVSAIGSLPFYTTSNTVSVSYTIPDNQNALSIGPITIATGVTVTIGTNETWTIV